MTTPLTRRSAIVGCAVTVVGGIAGFAVGRNSGAAQRKPLTAAANGYGPAPAATGHPLAPLSRVPEGGGLVLSSERIVLTREATGAVHGFSAVCTHQGCTVSRVANGTIDCPCHGSRFDAVTGRVVAGPATRPLPPVPVVVRHGEVYPG